MEDAGDSRLSLAKSREICCWQSSVTTKFSVNWLVTVDCKQQKLEKFASDKPL